MRTEFAKERRLIVKYARECLKRGLIVGTSGNLSISVGRRVAITPSGLDFRLMKSTDVCVLDSDGNVIEGQLLPSSEWQLHLGIYANNDASAIVHTHSPYATAVSTILDALPAIHYHVANMGGPVPVAPYATFGSRELAENVRQSLRGGSAVLMQNHGAVTIGDSLTLAFQRAETLEWLAKVYCVSAAITTPRLLSGDDLEDVMRARTSLRERKESMPGWR